MSATRTFNVVKASAVVAGDKFGFQKTEILRQDLDLLAYCGTLLDLGGSDDVGIISSSGGTFTPVRGYREYLLNADSLGGLTLDVVMFYRTSSAGTSVQLRVRDTTSPATLATGTSSTSTTLVKETVTVTAWSGDKDIRLEIASGNTNAEVFGYAYLRFRKVPA
jgi:hypothetical protein